MGWVVVDKTRSLTKIINVSSDKLPEHNIISFKKFRLLQFKLLCKTIMRGLCNVIKRYCNQSTETNRPEIFVTGGGTLFLDHYQLGGGLLVSCSDSDESGEKTAGVRSGGNTVSVTLSRAHQGRPGLVRAQPGPWPQSVPGPSQLSDAGPSHCQMSALGQCQHSQPRSQKLGSILVRK